MALSDLIYELENEKFQLQKEQAQLNQGLYAPEDIPNSLSTINARIHKIAVLENSIRSLQVQESRTQPQPTLTNITQPQTNTLNPTLGAIAIGLLLLGALS